MEVYGYAFDDARTRSPAILSRTAAFLPLDVAKEILVVPSVAIVTTVRENAKILNDMVRGRAHSRVRAL